MATGNDSYGKPTGDQDSTGKQDTRCPTCGSPQPQLHPAMQSEGEVQPCKDQWHNQPAWRTVAVIIASILLVHGLGGCSAMRLVNVPPCTNGTIRVPSQCYTKAHFPDGLEVHCPTIVMTDHGPVQREKIVTYHCMKARL